MNHDHNMLYVAKIKEAQEKLHPETFDLDELIDELKKYAEKELNNKGKSHVNVETFKLTNMKKCCVHVDRVRLWQIFTSLLDYSIKLIDMGYVLFGYHTSVSNNMNFFVEDTGLGIYNEDDPDLLIAKGLVQTMGGKMEVRPSKICGMAIDFNIICTGVEICEN
jgi:signal transduction histidine kinase